MHRGEGHGRDRESIFPRTNRIAGQEEIRTSKGGWSERGVALGKV